MWQIGGYSYALDEDVDLNLQNDEGSTLLYCAAAWNEIEIVRLLLAVSGIDINKANNEEKTPLYRAAEYGNIEVMRLLLTVPGIDINKANNEGKTPLDRAAEQNRIEIIDLLHGVGARTAMQLAGVAQPEVEQAAASERRIQFPHQGSKERLMAIATLRAENDARMPKINTNIAVRELRITNKASPRTTDHQR